MNSIEGTIMLLQIVGLISITGFLLWLFFDALKGLTKLAKKDKK